MKNIAQPLRPPTGLTEAAVVIHSVACVSFSGQLVNVTRLSVFVFYVESHVDFSAGEFYSLAGVEQELDAYFVDFVEPRFAVLDVRRFVV